MLAYSRTGEGGLNKFDSGASSHGHSGSNGVFRLQPKKLQFQTSRFCALRRGSACRALALRPKVVQALVRLDRSL